MSKPLHPLILDDGILEAYLEKGLEGRLFIHVYVKKWSTSSYRHILSRFVDLIEELQNKGYTEIYAASLDYRLEKFASMFGFVKTSEKIEDSDGNIREVLKCSISTKDT